MVTELTRRSFGTAIAATAVTATNPALAAWPNSGPSPAVPPPLDQLSTSTPPMAAYGVRRLRSAYSGFALNVRRDNDNTTKDIGFYETGALNLHDLTAFVSTNNGFVTKWYDQSGNGLDVLQATSSLQPRIVSTGVLDTTIEGNVGVNLGYNYTALTPNNNIFLQNGSTVNYTANESYIIHANNWVGPGNQDGTRAGEFMWSANNADTNISLSDHLGDQTRRDCYGDFTSSTVYCQFNNHPAVYSLGFGGSSGAIFSMQFSYNNVTSQFHRINTRSSQQGVTVGCYITGPSGFGQQSYNGKICELLIYSSGNSLSSNDRATLFGNHKAYYAIDLSRVADALPYKMVAGFSTRRLRRGYTGPLINVRRDSDNTTQDISFVSSNNDNLNTAALLSFVGSASSNNGFVTKWYDQSAWANHVIQSSTPNQPQIVTAGVVNTLNGKPILFFNSTTSGTVGLSISPSSNLNPGTAGFGSAFIVEKSLLTSFPAFSTPTPFTTAAAGQGFSGSICQGNIVSSNTWTGATACDGVNSFTGLTVNNVNRATCDSSGGNGTTLVTGNLETLQNTNGVEQSIGGFTNGIGIGCIPGSANTGHPGYIGEALLFDEGPQVGPTTPNDITVIYNYQKAWWGTP